MHFLGLLQLVLKHSKAELKLIADLNSEADKMRKKSKFDKGTEYFNLQHQLYGDWGSVFISGENAILLASNKEMEDFRRQITQILNSGILK